MLVLGLRDGPLETFRGEAGQSTKKIHERENCPKKKSTVSSPETVSHEKKKNNKKINNIQFDNSLSPQLFSNGPSLRSENKHFVQNYSRLAFTIHCIKFQHANLDKNVCDYFTLQIIKFHT